MTFIRYIPRAAMALGLLLVTAAAVAAGPSYRLAVDGLSVLAPTSTPRPGEPCVSRRSSG